MNTQEKDRKSTMSRLTQCLLAATVAGLVVMPIAFAGAQSGPVATKSASLAKQVKSLKKRVAALEGRQTGNNNTTTARPTGPAGGDLTGTYPNPTIGPDKVTEPKIAPDSVGASELIESSVGSNQLALDSVGSLAIVPDAVGASELKGMHAVVGSGVGIAAGGTDTASVTCPAGEMVIGGGYAWQTSQAGLSVVDSAPSEANPNTTWIVTGRPTSANTLFAWANCLNV